MESRQSRNIIKALNGMKRERDRINRPIKDARENCRREITTMIILFFEKRKTWKYNHPPLAIDKED